MKNVAVSVHQRLLNRMRTDGRPFMELLQYYSMERFLYRLSQSAQVRNFVLKGALMLRIWGAPGIRPTMDIDLLCRNKGRAEEVVSWFRTICSQPVEDDGLLFDAEKVVVEPIVGQVEEGGYRVRLSAHLAKTQISLQVDVGFGDDVFPEPVEAELPALLDFPAARLWCYNRETAIAEKFEAMLARGELNSRMKDFYDIWMLSRQFNFAGETLCESIRHTFSLRNTSIDSEAPIFLPSFSAQKEVQWRAFMRKLPKEQLPPTFAHVMDDLLPFLLPVAAAIQEVRLFDSRWIPPGPWS